jgi:hypothetical protein
MNLTSIRSSQFARPAWALLIASAALGCGSAMAATKGDGIDAVVRYQQDRADCVSGQTGEDRATCLREAGAAFAQAKQGMLDDGQSMSQFQRNALQRCQPLPDEDRLACRARMQGMGTISGSVEGGGILRELVVEHVGAPILIQPDAESTLP